MVEQQDPQEIAWVNMAKAFCIILVVMMHSGEHMISLSWSPHTSLNHVWTVLNAFLRPIRMPLFFLVSGLLASNSIASPRDDTERKRLVRPLYLYVLWGVIYQIAIPVMPDTSWSRLSMDNNAMPVLLMGVLSWYMAALGIYYVLTKMTLGMSLRSTLLLCGGLSVLATFSEPLLMGQQHKVLRCAIFFVAGARMKEPIIRFVARATVRRAILLGAAYVCGAVLCVRANTFFLPVDILAVAAGATLSGLAATHVGALIPAANWLARRTLPIYLVHFLLLPVLGYAIKVWAAPVLGSFWAGAIYPVLVTPIIMAVSLGLYRVVVRLGALWLFDLPQMQERHRRVQALPA